MYIVYHTYILLSIFSALLYCVLYIRLFAKSYHCDEKSILYTENKYYNGYKINIHNSDRLVAITHRPHRLDCTRTLYCIMYLQMYSILYSPRAALYNYCIVGVLSCVIMAVNITCTLWTEHSKLWMCPLISPILTAPICYSTNTNRTMKWMLKSEEKTNEHISASRHSRAVLCYYCSQLAAENIRESRNKLIIFSRKASNQAHLSILCVLSCIVWHSESERSRRLHFIDGFAHNQKGVFTSAHRLSRKCGYRTSISYTKHPNQFIINGISGIIRGEICEMWLSMRWETLLFWEG